MKLRVRILSIAIIVLALAYGLSYTFLSIKGKAIITKQLESLTKKKVNIGYFGITAPLNLQLKNIEIQELAKINSVSVSPSIAALLTGTIVLNEVKIIQPELNFERTAAATATPAAGAPAPKKIRPLKLVIRRLIIKDGSMNFLGQGQGVSEVKINLTELNFNLNNLYMFPYSAITEFDLKAKIPWQEAEKQGKVEAAGWLNFFKKDMQANVKIEGIDGISLYPYYSNWVDLKNARIEKARLNFTSDIRGLNNNVTARCRLELTDIVRRPLEEGELPQKASKITDAVLDIFRALDQGNVVLNFTINTKMDRPEFGFGDIRMAFEDKLTEARKREGTTVQKILDFPGKLIEGAFKSASELTRAVFDGTASIGKEVKKTVEEVFRKP